MLLVFCYIGLILSSIMYLLSGDVWAGRMFLALIWVMNIAVAVVEYYIKRSHEINIGDKS